MPRRSKKKTSNINNNNNNNNNKKRKKPKFLSLRHLNLNHNPSSAAADEESSAAADFFAAAVDGCGPTLASLFGPPSPSDASSLPDTAHDSTMGSPSLTCTAAGGGEEGEEMLLLRTAMRRGREEREEKWVCYEEVTSCCGAADDGDDDANVHHQRQQQQQQSGRQLLLSLKLDYQEIIDAWCDKGPFYMPGPQIVPDLSHDFGLNDGWRSNGAMWTVPENTVGVKVEQELEEERKIRHREASVLRYKEKRQNRLFSKRIRYEVRKINAEKRPRMKGRFVKRN